MPKKTIGNENYSLELDKVAGWNRQTVADGVWLNNNTIRPLDKNEEVLASAILYTSAGLDYTSAGLDFASAGIDFVSAGLQTASGILQSEIETMQGASDVVEVFANDAEFEYFKEHLPEWITDKDIIKILNDEEEDETQTYYRYDKPNDTWTYIGKLDPYYNKSEIDIMMSNVEDGLEGASAYVESAYNASHQELKTSADQLYSYLSNSASKLQNEVEWTSAWVNDMSGAISSSAAKLKEEIDFTSAWLDSAYAVNGSEYIEVTSGADVFGKQQTFTVGLKDEPYELDAAESGNVRIYEENDKTLVSAYPWNTFYAIAESTQFNEIKAAYDKGHTILLKEDLTVYNLVYASETEFDFVRIDQERPVDYSIYLGNRIEGWRCIKIHDWQTTWSKIIGDVDDILTSKEYVDYISSATSGNSFAKSKDTTSTVSGDLFETIQNHSGARVQTLGGLGTKDIDSIRINKYGTAISDYLNAVSGRAVGSSNYSMLGFLVPMPETTNKYCLTWDNTYKTPKWDLPDLGSYTQFTDEGDGWSGGEEELNSFEVEEYVGGNTHINFKSKYTTSQNLYLVPAPTSNRMLVTDSNGVMYWHEKEVIPSIKKVGSGSYGPTYSNVSAMNIWPNSNGRVTVMTDGDTMPETMGHLAPVIESTDYNKALKVNSTGTIEWTDIGTPFRLRQIPYKETNGTQTDTTLYSDLMTDLDTDKMTPILWTDCTSQATGDYGNRIYYYFKRRIGGSQTSRDYTFIFESNDAYRNRIIRKLVTNGTIETQVVDPLVSPPTQAEDNMVIVANSATGRGDWKSMKWLLDGGQVYLSSRPVGDGYPNRYTMGLKMLSVEWYQMHPGIFVPLEKTSSSTSYSYKRTRFPQTDPVIATFGPKVLSDPHSGGSAGNSNTLRYGSIISLNFTANLWKHEEYPAWIKFRLSAISDNNPSGNTTVDIKSVVLPGYEGSSSCPGAGSNQTINLNFHGMLGGWEDPRDGDEDETRYHLVLEIDRESLAEGHVLVEDGGEVRTTDFELSDYQISGIALNND